MRFTELPRVQPSPRAIQISEAVLPRRLGVRGGVSQSEAQFLLTLIEEIDAKRLVEIGVASGSSTLYMLAMLSAMGGFRQLFALDLDHEYFGDRSKPAGYLALESEFNRDDRLVMRTGAVGADLRTIIAEAGGPPGALVDFAFVDGNHRHPWATLDLLFLLPLMREGGIVAFHDINLPHVTDAPTSHGPMTLFSRAFPDRRVLPIDPPNVGAMRVVDKTKMIETAIEALSDAWEARVDFVAARMAAEIRRGPLAPHAAALAPYIPGL